MNVENNDYNKSHVDFNSLEILSFVSNTAVSLLLPLFEAVPQVLFLNVIKNIVYAAK